MCIFCWSNTAFLLCPACGRELRFVGATTISGVRVESAVAHESVARRMVHLLKYQGMEAAGSVLAALMASRLQPDAEALVPVPRAGLRRLRFGVDPARVLADSLAQLTGIPVVPGLAAALWWPSHAGSNRDRRQAPRLRAVRSLPEGSVLVDDVLTTGATIVAAAGLTGCRRAVTATRAESRCLE